MVARKRRGPTVNAEWLAAELHWRTIMTFAWEFVLTVLLTTAAVVCLAEVWQQRQDRDSQDIRTFRDRVKKGH